MVFHRQARVRAPEWMGRKRISVDANIAPTLREVWALGMTTIASCEDCRHPQDSGRGAQIVFRGRDSDHQAAAFAFFVTGIKRPSTWRFEAIDKTQVPSTAVWFPRELLEVVPTRLRRWRHRLEADGIPAAASTALPARSR
jgi:hypothetical protein